MAGLTDPETVDLIAQDAGGDYLVIMVEDRAWDADPEQPDQLRAKLNAYAGFILGGDLAHQYPETAGAPVRIRLDCDHEPPPEVMAIIDHGREQLDELGIGLDVHVRG